MSTSEVVMTCFLCDEVDRGGISCCEDDATKTTNNHYYCKSCFQNYIYSRVEYLKKEKIDIPCASQGCKNAFSRRRIRDTNLLTCEQYEYYLCRVMSLETDSASVGADADKVRGKLERGLSTEQKLHEQNLLNLLQLRCSNESCQCLVLIDADFKDCFKLTCDSCHHNLCGWCFKDLGTKSDYYHIANCSESENFGQVYAKNKVNHHTSDIINYF